MRIVGAMVIAAVLLMGQVAWADHHEAADAAAAQMSGDMSGMPVPVDGEIVHTEIYAADLAASQSFYGDLFGWTFIPMMEGYIMFMDASGTHTGGLTSELGEGPTEVGRMCTTIYLYCSDIDAKMAEIEAHGGMTYLPKMAVPTVGWIAIFGDPSGNPIGLFTNDPSAGSDMGGAAHGGM